MKYYAYKFNFGKSTPTLDPSKNRIGLMLEGEVNNGQMNGFHRKIDFISKTVEMGFYKDDTEYGKNIQCINGSIHREGIWQNGERVKAVVVRNFLDNE
jgi:hypothetical protein